MEAARHAHEGECGSIKIGIPSRLGGVLSAAIAEHCKRFPALDVQRNDICSSLQNEAMRNGEIDIGFFRPQIDHAHLDCELLFEEEFVVVLPATHRLAKRRFLRAKDIAGETSIIFDRSFSSWLYDKILGLYSRQGLRSHLTVTHVEDEEAGALMVAAGKAILLGVGATANHSVPGADLVSIRLSEPEVKIELYMAWRKNEQSTAVFSFLDSVRRVMRRPAYRDIA